MSMSKRIGVLLLAGIILLGGLEFGEWLGGRLGYLSEVRLRYELELRGNRFVLIFDVVRSRHDFGVIIAKDGGRANAGNMDFHFHRHDEQSQKNDIKPFSSFAGFSTI